MFVLVLLTAGATPLAAATMSYLGPDGGDARAFAYDPRNPERIFLGTSAGKLFLSTDGGATWTRFAQLGKGEDFVLDNISIDPRNPDNIYVAAWSLENKKGSDGELFRSRDGGKTWETLNGMHGKSIRAMELAPSDPSIIVVGALDGVFRSKDGGQTWERLSPEGHPQIHNVESVAVDPVDPDIVYAGTWHLPWKTADGGKTWKSNKTGLIDDSDVFSIIVSGSNPKDVYLSACSGIYKSENQGELFRKVVGMPFSARRTRVLMQDPAAPETIYAGTTEGLWKSTDAGKSFKRMTGPNVIVNDVMVDPRQHGRVLLATDRIGVMVSDNGGERFTVSNRGFAHRQVTALLADRYDPQTLYAGVLNDKEFGGVFVSRDSGVTWSQSSLGLGGRDVFSLRQTAAGDLLAGTNSGVFMMPHSSALWVARKTLLSEKPAPVAKRSKPTRSKGAKPAEPPKMVAVKGELNQLVSDVEIAGDRWFAGTPTGLFASSNAGASWRQVIIVSTNAVDFVSVRSQGSLIAAATRRNLFLSPDGGAGWYEARTPSFITLVRSVAIAPDNSVWLATREGVFRSDAGGEQWEHVLNGLPATNARSVSYDVPGRRLLVTGGASNVVYASSDGRRWKPALESALPIRAILPVNGRLLVATSYDGIMAPAEAPPAPATAQSAAAPAANEKSQR